MIENGYELESETDDKTIYGFDIDRDSIDGSKSTKWSYYFNDDEFVLSFSRNTSLSELLNLQEDRSENEYDLIVEDIKKNCNYYDIRGYKNVNYENTCFRLKWNVGSHGYKVLRTIP
tara:strand:+ start:267 stop:617 length:351 start_codon:yes stop_codon:yes gene_type:complete